MGVHGFFQRAHRGGFRTEFGLIHPGRRGFSLGFLHLHDQGSRSIFQRIGNKEKTFPSGEKRRCEHFVGGVVDECFRSLFRRRYAFPEGSEDFLFGRVKLDEYARGLTRECVQFLPPAPGGFLPGADVAFTTRHMFLQRCGRKRGELSRIASPMTWTEGSTLAPGSRVPGTSGLSSMVGGGGTTGPKGTDALS